MQESINVRVMRYERADAAQPFQAHLLTEYDTIVNPDETTELPVQVLKRDSKGNSLLSIGCLVARNRPSASVVAEESARPVRKARSVVAKTAPKPETNLTPDPVKKPRTSPARTKKPVEPEQPVRTSVKAKPEPTVRRAKRDLSSVLAYIESL